MIYVPIKHLQPCMVLARDIGYGSSVFSLVSAGQTLTPVLIQKLIKHRIPGAYIQCRFCDDVESDSFLEIEEKQKTLSDVKKIYDDFTHSKTVLSFTYRSILMLAQELILMILSKDEVLVNLMDIKDYDEYTYTHSMNVGILSTLIGIKMGYTRSVLTELAMSGLLHDIGKVDIPHDIVNKPGKLTPQEFKIMQTHPQKAAVRLRRLCMMPASVISGIVSHHEKFDGSGYPNHFEGQKIPEFGRILAVADVYDALTSRRAYRKAWSSCEAIEYMMGCAQSHLDIDILQIFLQTVAAYPVGSIVQLSGGGVAVVTKNTLQNTLRPTVRVILPEEIRGKEMDLSMDESCLNVTITGILDDDTYLPVSFFETLET